MWLLKDSAGLVTDLYELTMAQAYFEFGLNDRAYFEVTIRTLPPNWGYFVMAGLSELQSYLEQFKFTEQDLEYLESLGIFSAEFLDYLGKLRAGVEIRCLPEGTIFFPQEPILEVGGPLITAQLLESYVLNILGFSVVSASLGCRVQIAAKGRAVMDFGLRRSQGLVASIRAARGAQMACFSGTSNVYAARLLDFRPAGTMAHSYIQVHRTEEEAFRRFIELYGENSVLLVDTYDVIEGIKKAALVARDFYEKRGLKIRGIRIDSGDFVSLSKFAREHFREKGVEFMKIFVSSGLDEYRIADLLEAGAEIDGFGIGTRFAVSHSSPATDIVYKIVEYAGRGLYKTSPDKQTRPRRKTILRSAEDFYTADTVVPYSGGSDDLLKPFRAAESMETIRQRLSAQLSMLPQAVKAIRKPSSYPVKFLS